MVRELLSKVVTFDVNALDISEYRFFFVEFFREPINNFCLIILQELRPTLDELGISTPEELGYDKPELGLPSPFEIHG